MPSPAEPLPRWQDLLGPLLAGEADPVRALLAQALRSDHSRCVVYDTLLVPCLRQIGELWEHGEITVPDEHLASHTLTGVLHDLRTPPVTSPSAPTAVVSCAPLDGHRIPTLLAGDLLSDAGWRVWQLGSSSPADELAAFVRRHDPRLLVLTATMTRTMTGVVAVTRALRDHHGTAILAGGAGVKYVRDPSAVGVDALGHRLGDLLTFAATVASTTRTPARHLPTAAGRAAATALQLEHVEVALREAGTSLSISEIGERCGTTNAQVGVVLTRLERSRRVRFIGGRWKAETAKTS